MLEEQLLKKSIQRNFRKTLNEFVTRDQQSLNELDEGFSDVANTVKNGLKKGANAVKNGLKNGVQNLGKETGILHPERDEYEQRNKQDGNLGSVKSKGKRVANTLLNASIVASGLASRIMGGNPQNNSTFRGREEKYGGMFAKGLNHPYENTQQYNEYIKQGLSPYDAHLQCIKDKGISVINNMLSHMALANMLSTVCKPSQVSITRDQNNFGGYDYYLQFVKRNSNINYPEYGGNLVNAIIDTKQYHYAVAVTNREIQNILFNNVNTKTKNFKQGKGYEHFEQKFNEWLQEAEVDPEFINSEITSLGGQLDNIDSYINTLLMQKKLSVISNLGAMGNIQRFFTLIQNDSRITGLLNKKAEIVNNKLNEIAMMAKKHAWHLGLGDRTNIFSWYFDMNQLYGMLSSLPRWNVNMLMTPLGTN